MLQGPMKVIPSLRKALWNLQPCPSVRLLQNQHWPPSTKHYSIYGAKRQLDKPQGEGAERDAVADESGSPIENNGKVRTILSNYANSSTASRLSAWITSTMQGNLSGEPMGGNIAPGIHVAALGLDVDKKKFCVRISYEKPETANALDTQAIQDLTDIFRSIVSYHSVKGICFTNGLRPGTTSYFCSGAFRDDLANLAGPRDARKYIQAMSDLCQSIRLVPVPVVALIDGPCIGAGLELAASCDIRVATERSTFSMPEVLLGIPSVIEARLLCNIVGWGRARNLMLTGTTWPAREARQTGLISLSFPGRRQMMGWSMKYMSQLLENGEAYRIQKKLLRSWENKDTEGSTEIGVRRFGEAFVNGPKNISKLKDKAISTTAPKSSSDSDESRAAAETSPPRQKENAREDQPQ